jgi:VWFA-related protein
MTRASVQKSLRHFAASVVSAALVAAGSWTLTGRATVHAAGDPQNALLSVRITSPLGRLGLPGAIRIVAQVKHPPQLALESVRFYVNETLVGNAREGPPYAIDWTDANPYEPTRIRVDATDARGNTASDAIELAPFEITEVTGASRVLLEATVTDKADRFVGGLDANAFRVLENDEPQTIDLVSIESLPVTYTLLVDASQSMHNRMEFVRTAAGRLADFLRPNDRIIVAPFARSLGSITGPTNDRDTIAGGVRAISSSGGTAIFDGLIEASRLVPANDRRHVIVLITDGYDENSRAKVDDALVAVKSAGATVYVIGVGGIAGISLKGERVLRQIAQETGGRVFFPSREQELPAVHEQVAQDVRQRYLVSYSPEDQDADGAWRRITLFTTDPSHRIRTRAGYFAPKPPPVRPSLEFTVTDANRELVELSRDDLVVLEDGVAQKVDTFQEAVAPVSVVLALDASGSMAKAADAVKTAARSFIEALRPEDALSVLLFSDSSAFAHGLTTDRRQSTAAVNAYIAHGGTALYDGLTDALMSVKTTKGRKVVVLLSDGRDEDNAGTGPGSARTQEDAFLALKETDATIYPIGLGPHVDREFLERLATESGGAAYFPEDVSTLHDDYARIVAELRRRYLVSYTSTNGARDGAWRSVQIKTQQGELIVRSRGGYTAPER